MSKGKDYDYFYFLKVNKLIIYFQKDEFFWGEVYICKTTCIPPDHSDPDPTPCEEECRKWAVSISLGLSSVAAAGVQALVVKAEDSREKKSVVEENTRASSLVDSRFSINIC